MNLFRVIGQPASLFDVLGPQAAIATPAIVFDFTLIAFVELDVTFCI